MPKVYHILVVEDDIFFYNNVAENLKESGFSVSEYVPSVAKALAAIKKKKPDLAILDIDLNSELTGFDMGKILKDKNIPFIFLTGYTDDLTFFEGLKLGHEHFITKDELIIDFNQLTRNIYTVLSNKTTKSQTIDQSIGISCLKNFLKETKESGTNDSIEVLVKFENIILFTTDHINLKPVKNNYILVLTKDQNHYYLKNSLSEILKVLPEYFVRVNQKYIINLKTDYFLFLSPGHPK